MRPSTPTASPSTWCRRRSTRKPPPGRGLTGAGRGGEGGPRRQLAVTGLRASTAFYDYAAKYTDGVTEHLVQAPGDEETDARALDWAGQAHRSLGCRGVSRADFRYDDARSELVMLEVNTQPGMTRLSLVPEQATHCGIAFTDLVSWLVETARCD